MLRAGLYIALEVAPGERGGQLRMIGMEVRPLVVGGRCGDVKVKALPGMPPSVLRWAAATLVLREFRPPQYDGVRHCGAVQAVLPPEHGG